jgi:hypothetical protein
MTKQWLINFWNVYDECASRGTADGPGGAEFHRVLIDALHLYPRTLEPRDFTAFIERGERPSRHESRETRRHPLERECAL